MAGRVQSTSRKGICVRVRERAGEDIHLRGPSGRPRRPSQLPGAFSSPETDYCWAACEAVASQSNYSRGYRRKMGPGLSGPHRNNLWT